jgi:hypothetical protein
MGAVMRVFSRGEVRLQSDHPFVDPVVEFQMLSDNRDQTRLRSDPTHPGSRACRFVRREPFYPPKRPWRSMAQVPIASSTGEPDESRVSRRPCVGTMEDRVQILATQRGVKRWVDQCPAFGACRFRTSERR